MTRRLAKTKATRIRGADLSDDDVVQAALNIMSLDLRKLAFRIIGASVFLASAYYIWGSLHHVGAEFHDIVAQDAAFYIFIAAASLVYAVSLTLLNFAWVSFLPAKERHGRQQSLLRAYGLSSII